MDELIKAHLLHYEETLERHGMQLPYTVPVRQRLVSDDYKSVISDVRPLASVASQTEVP